MKAYSLHHGRVASLVFLLLALPTALQAQFTYTTNNGAITITKYKGEGPVIIPSTTNGLPVTSIGDGAFSFCYNVTAVSVPESVTNIGSSAFMGCLNLRQVNVPKNVCTIGSLTFQACSALTNIEIPASAAKIADDAFLSCQGLLAITVDAANAAYSSADGVFFDKTQRELIAFPGGKAGGYTIPQGVTTLRDVAFAFCYQLTTITISCNVTNIDAGAFAGGILTSFIVDPTNPTFSSIDGLLFDKAQGALIKCPAAKAGSYSVPDTVTQVVAEAFYSCKNLTNVTIGDRVRFIGDYAFYLCTNLEAVYFKANAPSLGESVFGYDDIVGIYYLPGTDGWAPVFGDVPTTPWFLPNPVILNNGSGFGTRTSGFGFTISWATNAPVIVEACAGLPNAAWQPLQTCTLTSGSIYFTDPDWTNYSTRIYRLRSP